MAGWLEKMAKVSTKQHKSIELDDIIAFFQQFSVLLNAGTPLLNAINICSEQCESVKLAKILKEMAKKISGGDSFYLAISKYPKVFKPHWTQMVNTGEITGQLAPLMLQLTEYIQTSKKIQGKISGAMIYPSILIGVACLSVFIMLWKVVPTFASFFQDFGSELPPITQTVINISEFIQAKWWMIFLAVFAVVFLFKKFNATPYGKRTVDTALLAVPALGDLLVESAMEKFGTNMALLLKNGTTLMEAFETIQEVFKDNAVYYDLFVKTEGYVARGGTMSSILEESGLFTPMMINMIKMGEESGKLVEALEKGSVFYREKIEGTVSRVTGLIEPLVVIVMGVVIAGILSSIYIPMFQMAGGPG